MIDDRRRVVAPDHAARRFLVHRPHRPRRVDELRRHPRELRHVLADELPAGIELLALRHRIEDPEVGLRVAAGRRRPLPAAVVRGEIEVVEVVGEVPLAAAPVDVQILHQERRRDHTQAVVHVTGLVELPHRRVDQRIPGAALAPRAPLRLVVREGERVERRLEGVADDVREVVEDREVEIPPDEFGEPGFGAASAERVRGLRELADRDRAEAQVHRQVRRSLHRGEVAALVIDADAVEEGLQQPLRARHAGRDIELAQVRRREAERRQRRQPRLRRPREVAGVLRDRIGLEVESVELLQPCVLVRGEDGERAAGAGQQLVPLEDRLVLEGVKRDPRRAEGARHLGVAVLCGRLVVVVRVDGRDGELACEPRDRVARTAVQHGEPAAAAAKARVELGHRVPDELDAPVGAGGQRVEDLGVEAERAVDTAVRFQRVVQGGVVVVAEIAPEPHQRGVAVGGHATPDSSTAAAVQSGPCHGWISPITS